MRRPVQPHVVLEQELQALLQEDLEMSNEERKADSGGDDDAKNAIKKRVRVIKNRLAAKRSREQARTYVQQLESTLNALAAHNEFLARRLVAVEAENDSLKRGFSYHSHKPADTLNQKDFRGEPAVLPTSSLQLDGFFLISVLSVVCSHYLQIMCPIPPTHRLQPMTPRPMPMMRTSRLGRRPSRRSKRHLRRAGLLLSAGHLCRLKPHPPEPHRQGMPSR